MDNQIKRVLMLNEMVKETLSQYQQEQKEYKKWKEDNPDEYWYDWNSNRIYKSEIKRLMLVQRQEMIKLEKML